MRSYSTRTQLSDDDRLQARRLDLLDFLSDEVERRSQVIILPNLRQNKSAAFIISDPAAKAIREALQNIYLRVNESSALARVSSVAQTPDASGIVYRIDSFQFETIGTADYVVGIERDSLKPGEIEVHTHVYSRPEFLDQVDINDVIATVSGPAWNGSLNGDINDGHLRIFGVLSIHKNGLARLQFYLHNLRDDLSARNNYGLSRLGAPITLLDVF